jgi:hypothetical protein
MMLKGIPMNMGTENNITYDLARAREFAGSGDIASTDRFLRRAISGSEELLRQPRRPDKGTEHLRQQSPAERGFIVDIVRSVRDSCNRVQETLASDLKAAVKELDAAMELWAKRREP